MFLNIYGARHVVQWQKPDIYLVPTLFATLSDAQPVCLTFHALVQAALGLAPPSFKSLH